MRCRAITPSLLWTLVLKPTQAREFLNFSKAKKLRIGSGANPIFCLWRVGGVSVVASKNRVNGRFDAFMKLLFMKNQKVMGIAS